MANMHKIGSTATTVRTENGYTIVRYHNTDVVKFNSDEIVLNTGGWKTNTTKARMNQTSNVYGLGYRVYQIKGTWYVDCLDEENGIGYGKTISFNGDRLTIRR